MSQRLSPAFDAPDNTLALIVLSTDESLEPEAAQICTPAGIRLLHSRIPSLAEVTPETLATMAEHLPAAAALLPGHVDVVGYGCTSGATVIGPERVAELVNGPLPGARVTNPITAVETALKALGARRIAYVSPYVASVTAPMRAHLARAGVETVAEGSFDVGHDPDVARITEAAVAAGAETVASGQAVDAVFVSCTNLRSFGIIDALEARLGLPVISSNLALIWHMLHLAGLGATPGPGRLFATRPSEIA
ncbi:MAG: Asp/Glu racemase [Alphaproteobacteria bacterium]|nr:MAG: Asp/Glu racemase [Alphaproteobacteria bacterium]